MKKAGTKDVSHPVPFPRRTFDTRQRNSDFNDGSIYHVLFFLYNQPTYIEALKATLS